MPGPVRYEQEHQSKSIVYIITARFYEDFTTLVPPLQTDIVIYLSRRCDLSLHDPTLESIMGLSEHDTSHFQKASLHQTRALLMRCSDRINVVQKESVH